MTDIEQVPQVTVNSTNALPPVQVSLGPTGYVLLGACLVLLVVIMLRRVVLWYWKMDRIVDLLEEIRLNTSAIRYGNRRSADGAESAGSTPGEGATNETAPGIVVPPVENSEASPVPFVICGKCGARLNRQDLGAHKCRV